jgi:hypothetical protein
MKYCALRRPFARWRSLLVLALSLTMAAHAFAWGAQGHEVIASVAWQRLNPQARQEVTRLLAQEPGQTLESIATWADEHRSPATGVWHYVNFPRTSCKYEPERDCPGGRCVVAAIAHQAAVFASHASDAERLKALKYLVHLVGDVHQPLHAGYQDDRGGNRFQLQLWMHARNLHAVWDSGLLRNVDLDNEAFSALLRRVPVASDVLDLDPAHMAQESCRIVAQAGFYPDTGLSAAYTQRFTPVLQQRLALAAARLAALLNAAVAQSQAEPFRSALVSMPVQSLKSPDLER